MNTAAEIESPKTVRSSKSRDARLEGSLRFGLASLLVYATVAFGERWMYRHLGLLGSYGVWTLLFIGFGGLALKPLVVQPKAKRTFWRWFSLAFFAYAAGWMASYFTLRGAAGEWLGSLLGSATLGLVLAIVFGAKSRYARISARTVPRPFSRLFPGRVVAPLFSRENRHAALGRMLWAGVWPGSGARLILGADSRQPIPCATGRLNQ